MCVDYYVKKAEQKKLLNFMWLIKERNFNKGSAKVCIKKIINWRKSFKRLRFLFDDFTISIYKNESWIIRQKRHKEEERRRKKSYYCECRFFRLLLSECIVSRWRFLWWNMLQLMGRSEMTSIGFFDPSVTK